MASINISPADSISFRELNAGNPVQVRVTVQEQEQNEYKKGQLVKVTHINDETTGKIVSDPIVIEENKENKSKILSLIIEKPE